MKKIFSVLLIFIMSAVLISCDFGSADTTETTLTTEPIITDVFIDISTIAELQAIEMNKSYRLVSDIDLSSITWTPLGTFSSPYLGIFDGNGYTIQGMTIDAKNDNFNGLFGYLGGEVRDLALTDIDITYQTSFLTYAGGIAGFTEGNIIDCTVNGDISVNNIGSNSYIGLLTGFSQTKLDNFTLVEDFVSNQIQGNSVNGTVYVNEAEIAFVGGMIGKAYNSHVVENYSDVVVTVIANGENLPTYVGGFIGHNYGGILLSFTDQVEDPNIYVEKNINLGTVNVTNTEANIYVGGFMGFNQKGYINDNYSDTDLVITGTKTIDNIVRIGGFIGENYEAYVKNIVLVSSLDKSGFVGEIETGIFICGMFSEYDLDNIYFMEVGTSFTTLEDDNALLITTSDLDDSSFYINSLSWDPEFYNLIIDYNQE